MQKRTGETYLLLAPVLRIRLAVAVAVGVVLRRLLAVATASALVVVVVLRGHVVLSHFDRLRFRYDTVGENDVELFWGNRKRKMMSKGMEQLIDRGVGGSFSYH